MNPIEENSLFDKIVLGIIKWMCVCALVILIPYGAVCFFSLITGSVCSEICGNLERIMTHTLPYHQAQIIEPINTYENRIMSDGVVDCTEIDNDKMKDIIEKYGISKDILFYNDVSTALIENHSLTYSGLCLTPKCYEFVYPLSKTRLIDIQY